MQPGIVENLANSVDHCQLQALQFSVHLRNLLSILLRCNGFAKIQKAVVYQSSSKAPTVTKTFFCCKFGFGKLSFLELLLGPTTAPAVVYNPLFAACHNLIKKWFVVVEQNKS